MSTDAQAGARDPEVMSEDTATGSNTNKPNTPKGSDAPRAWDLMRAGHEADHMHPYWTHVITAAGGTMLGATVLSYLSVPWWGWVLTLVGLALVGGLLGAALTIRTDQHLAAAGQSAGAAWFAGTGGLALLMSATGWVGEPHGPDSAPVWITWAAMTLVGGVVHRYLWGRAVEAGDPQHPRGAKIRAKRNNSLWEAGFRRAGLGDVSVESVTERWSGVDVVGRTDPERATKTADIKAKSDAVVDLVHKSMREQGSADGLGLGEAQVFEKHDNVRDKFMMRVRTRDPLTETLTPVWPTDTEWTVRDHNIGVHLGYWDTGESMEVPPAGPHKAAAGSTGSGKSTWLISLEVGYSRRPHWTMWAAGTSKLMDLIQPAVDAAEEVEGKPLFEMWGGGDSGSRGELSAAERQVAAAYMLYLDRSDRSAKGKLPGREGRNFVGTEENPWVAVFLDEFNDMLKKSGGRKVKLPNGEKLSVWDMLVTIGEKSRAYGIELILVTQGTTNTAIGGSQQASNDLLGNANTRYLFATNRGSAHQDMLGSGKQDALAMAKKLESMDYACMASIRGQEASYAYGKVVHWDEDDIVHITRMANRHGTIGRLGEADRAALGDLYVQGAQPGDSIGETTKRTPDPSQADPSKWGAPTDSSQIANELLKASGGPSTSVSHDGDTEDAGDQADDVDESFEQEAQAEIDQLIEQVGGGDALSEDELSELRAQHQQAPRRPEEPEELLGDILDTWAQLNRPPKRATAGEIVEMCGLRWLDLKAEERREKAVFEGKSEDEADALVTAQAASKLGELLKGAPIWATPQRSNSGYAYSREDLQQSFDRIIDVDG